MGGGTHKGVEDRDRVTLYLGATGKWLCPVAAVLSYLVQRREREGPLFFFTDGRYLTRARFVAALRSALQGAGVDAQHYFGHSFRIRAATTAAACGVSDSTIQTLGRWRSSAYLVYIQTSPQSLITISRSLTSSV